MDDKRTKPQPELRKGIKAGNKLVTVTNPSKEFLRRFEQLKYIKFETLQDFLNALENTK